MERQYEHNGHTYWVKVEAVFNQETGQHGGYMAWVNDQQPGLINGQIVRNEQGIPMLFGDEFAAFANANAVKQSELGG